jgi:hypothetical protein
MARVLTVFPGFIPDGYFDEDNVAFIQKKVADILKREFIQEVIIDKASIGRVMQRVLSERIETVPKMNQRVIMYLCNEVRVHQLQVSKNLKLEAHYIESQRLYDPTTDRGPDLYSHKFRDTVNYPGHSVGGTTRFYFT